MENKNNLIIGVVVGFIVGAGVSYLYVSNSYKGNTFADGWSAAKNRLMETTPMFKELDGREIKVVSGVAQAVSGNVITVKINPLEPLADKSLDIREVTINDNTKIVIAGLKDSDTFQKEINDYQKQIQAIAKSGKGDIPKVPDQFIREVGTKESIVVSSDVTITAGANIKNSSKFTATEIVVKK